MLPKKNYKGEIIFNDFPDFKPNLTPNEIFKLGSFGGTYWRPIYSSVTNKKYINKHIKYPKSWWKGIPNNWLVTPLKKKSKYNDYTISPKRRQTLQHWAYKLTKRDCQ